MPTAWRRALVAAVLLRLVAALVAVVSGGLVETEDPQDVAPVATTSFEGWEATTPEEQGWGLIGGGLERYDALWYLALARDGYPDLATDAAPIPSAYAFFPLYPLLVGLTGRVLFGAWLLAANLVSFAATVAALAGIHRLIEVETGDGELAGRAIVTATTFPAAFFLVAPYTESTFLATSVWSLVAARTGRWPAAGGLGALAGLSRGIGAVLALPLLLEAWRQHRDGEHVPWTALVAIGGAPAGLVAYLLYARARSGELLAPVIVQDVWDRELTSPLATLRLAWRNATGWIGEYPVGYQTLDLVIFAVVAVGVVWLLLRTPLPYGMYALAHVVVWLLTPFPGRPLMSTYRFAVAIAPLPWAFALWTRRPFTLAAWCAVSGVFAGAMLLAFVNWRFVL